MKILEIFFAVFGLWFLVVPVRADFGCHFLVNSRATFSLNDPTQKFSCRFTCKDDLSLIGASLYCGEAIDSPGYQVSLHGDEKGIPAESVLGVAGMVPKGQGWFTVLFDNVAMEKGKAYHLVVEWDAKRGGQHQVGIIDAKHYASFAYTDFPNHFLPFDETPDPRTEVLVFEKGKWTELKAQPLYALQGTDQRRQGNPYDAFGDMPIYGNGDKKENQVLQGVALHPHCEITAKGLAVRVKKIGNPTSPLNYRVYSHDFMKHLTNLSFSGKALNPSDISDDYQWVTFGFQKQDNPRPFSDQCTYVTFQTDSGTADPKGGCDDCYLISWVGNSGGLEGAAEMSFDAGAHLSRAAASNDGGAAWIDLFERDANIVILGPSCPPNENNGIENPVPTPSAIYEVLPP